MLGKALILHWGLSLDALQIGEIAQVCPIAGPVVVCFIVDGVLFVGGEQGCGIYSCQVGGSGPGKQLLHTGVLIQVAKAGGEFLR